MMPSWVGRRRRTAEVDAGVRDALKRRVAKAFFLREEDTVTVSEIACADGGCPDVETVILVMRQGEPTSAFKIPRPISKIEDWDLEFLAARQSLIREGEP
jgi:hypothetical protein